MLDACHLHLLSVCVCLMCGYEMRVSSMSFVLRLEMRVSSIFLEMSVSYILLSKQLEGLPKQL